MTRRSRTLRMVAPLALLWLPVAGGCAQAPTGSGGEFSLDVSRLEPDTARFALVHQAQQVGSSDAYLTREGDTWTFRERTEVPGGFQETIVVFGPGPRMKRVEQRGQMEIAASGPVPLTYVVTARSPHDVLRIESPGPMTVVRMQLDE